MRKIRTIQLGVAALISTLLLLNCIFFSSSTTPSESLMSIDSSLAKVENMDIDTPIHLNATDLTIFLDEYIPSYMDENNVAGITISVVKEGELLLAKGYGYADVEQEIPVIANETLFSIASISKTFTATAVMKLVKNGTLDLNEDVNNYLKSFQVPNLHGANPISLAHLLKHTAGFEESLKNVFYANPADLLPMGEFLREFLPARVHHPGYIQSYSNLGSALAGFIVQEVTGVPYGQYLENSVLKPLGMNSTSAYQQPPSSLFSRHSKGYSYQGEFIENPYYYCVVPPCGGMSATARDMANFMIMHLNEGNYKGEQFLEEETALQMQAEQFIGHPMTGIGYGFYSRKLNNQTLVEHTGGMPSFTSTMSLLPEHDVGFFISINTDTGFYREILNNFIDRYYPAPTEILKDPLPTSRERLLAFEGIYLPTRRVYVNLDESLITMYGTIVTQIITLSDNSLLVRSNYLPIDGMSFIEVENLGFRDKSEQTDTSIFFREEGPGNITFMFLSSSALTAMEKIESWYLDVTGPESMEIEENINNQIYWSVFASDWQGSTYTVYKNGSSAVTDTWNTGIGIMYDLNNLTEGTYNFTIVIKDILGDEASHTVIVTVIPQKLSDKQTSFPNIGFIIGLLVVIVVIKKSI